VPLKLRTLRVDRKVANEDIAEAFRKRLQDVAGFAYAMSDLFHAGVPASYIQQVFDVMERANWHQFQVLTKRAERLTELNAVLRWPSNTWMGVSVENRRFVHRIDHLRSTDAHVKFLSLEPLLGPLEDLDLRGIGWVIVGGESGPKARPMSPAWVASIRDQCRRAGVAFFFKQWGGVFKNRTGRQLDGRTWDEMPRAVRAEPPGSHKDEG
jgi:protein gp37